MENEIMETEIMENEFDFTEEVNEDSGMDAGLVVLIGAGIAAATVAAVTLGKKAWNWIKSKKEVRKPEDDREIEVTDEDITKVTN